MTITFIGRGPADWLYRLCVGSTRSFLRQVASAYPVCSFWGTKKAALFGAAIDLGTDFTPIYSDRQRAYEIAQKRGVNFRPIYLFISDEAVWRERLAQRARQFPDAPVATWRQVDKQRRYFQPWQPGQALFWDGLNSVDDNFVAAMAFIANPTVRLTGWE